MKKLTALLLAVMLVASMAVAVSAESTTTLTTTVPAATYTLNIPADQEIPFGTESKKIGELTVTDAVSFAEGKNLSVEIAYTAFSSEDVVTTIPFSVYGYYKNSSDMTTKQTISSGSTLVFSGNSDGGLDVPKTISTGYQNERYVDLQYLGVTIDSTDWGKALAGDYTATITFTAEVVAE